MKRTLLAGIVVVAVVVVLGVQASGIAAKPAEDLAAQVRAVLNEQVAAWNRGDIEGFMQKYWKSERLVFVGSNGITRGWQTVLERYKRVYPDRAAMGKLTFSDLETTALGKDAALVLGRWKLERTADKPGGVFTLILRRFPEGWRIVHDHTSSTTVPAKPN
jgi:ketosteroid isomerase-like protein